MSNAVQLRHPSHPGPRGADLRRARRVPPPRQDAFPRHRRACRGSYRRHRWRVAPWGGGSNRHPRRRSPSARPQFGAVAHRHHNSRASQYLVRCRSLRAVVQQRVQVRAHSVVAARVQSPTLRVDPLHAQCYVRRDAHQRQQAMRSPRSGQGGRPLPFEWRRRCEPLAHHEGR